MKITLLSILPLVTLSAAVVGQGTVPPGYDTTESDGSSAYSYLLGFYQESHAQVANGDLKGKGKVAMKEISFRQDGRIRSPSAIDR